MFKGLIVLRPPETQQEGAGSRNIATTKNRCGGSTRERKFAPDDTSVHEARIVKRMWIRYNLSADGHAIGLELSVGCRFSWHLGNILNRRVSVTETAQSQNNPIENPRKDTNKLNPHQSVENSMLPLLIVFMTLTDDEGKRPLKPCDLNSINRQFARVDGLPLA